MFKTLQRYVLKDVLRTFFLALAVFTGVVLLGLIYEFVRAELSLGQMLVLLPYGLPFTLPFTLPIAALLATSLTFGRLSVDNEITAIRTSGVPIYVIIAPMLVFGVLVSVCSLLLQDRVIPPLNYKLKDVRMLAAKMLGNQKEGYNFRRKYGRYQIFASHVKGAEYEGLVVFHRPTRERMVKYVARRAKIGIGSDGNSIDVTVYDATITTYGVSRDSDGEVRISQDPIRISVPEHTLPMQIRSRARRQSDKTTKVLLTEAAYHEERAKQLAEEFSTRIVIEEAVLRELEEKREAVSDRSERKTLEAELREQEKKVRHLRAPEAQSLEIYRKNVAEAMGRWALALACLLSVVLGSVLPILMRPKNALIPFFAGVLVVVLFYFPMHRLGLELSENGTISPWIGPWLSDILSGILAGTLLWRVLRR